MRLQIDARSGGDASALVSYLETNGQLRDHMGRPVDDDIKEAWIKDSKHDDIRQHFIFSSAARHELSEEEIDKGVRRTMHEFTEGRSSVRYLYAIDMDHEHPHAHVAARGSRGDLRLTAEQIKELRDEIAAEHHLEPQIEQARELKERDLEEEQEQDLQKEQEQEWDLKREAEQEELERGEL